MTIGRAAACATAAAFALALLGACSGGGERVEDKVPERSGVAPAALIDLSHWQLTLPVDAHGGTQGRAATVRTAALLEGYESEWFYGSDEDGVTFWAPVNGALTPRSSFARSELRQMRDPDNASANWAWTDTVALTAVLEVNQVPSENGKVTVGQVLGYDGEDPDISVLAKLVFEHHANRRATLYALVYPSPYAPGSQAERLVIVEGLRLNRSFGYSIRLAAGHLHFATDARSVTAPIDPSWADVGLYMRAGVALQARGLDATDGGRVTFFELEQGIED